MVDCRSLDKDGRDLWGSAGDCRGLQGSVGIYRGLRGSVGIRGDWWKLVEICGDLSGTGRHLWVPPDIYGYLLTSVRVSGNRSSDFYT